MCENGAAAAAAGEETEIAAAGADESGPRTSANEGANCEECEECDECDKRDGAADTADGSAWCDCDCECIRLRVADGAENGAELLAARSVDNNKNIG